MNDHYYDWWKNYVSAELFTDNSVLIDFDPGSSGNFLDYLINSQLFGVFDVAIWPFTDIYTVDSWKTFDDSVNAQRKCFACHWTYHQIPILVKESMTLIRVVSTDTMSRLISFFGHWQRAGDVLHKNLPADVKIESTHFKQSICLSLTHLHKTSLNWNQHNGTIIEIPLSQLFSLEGIEQALNTVGDLYNLKVQERDYLIKYSNIYIDNHHGLKSYNRVCNFLKGNAIELTFLEEIAVVSELIRNNKISSDLDILVDLFTGSMTQEKIALYR